jgi:hypothetical protein
LKKNIVFIKTDQLQNIVFNISKNIRQGLDEHNRIISLQSIIYAHEINISNEEEYSSIMISVNDINKDNKMIIAPYENTKTNQSIKPIRENDSGINTLIIPPSINPEINTLINTSEILLAKEKVNDSIGNKDNINNLENKLNEILDAYNKKNGLEHTGDKASHIAIGHTVQNAGINSICNKRVWRTDSAMSKAFGDNSNEPNRKPQVLEILDNGKITHLIL